MRYEILKLLTSQTHYNNLLYICYAPLSSRTFRFVGDPAQWDLTYPADLIDD